MSPGRVMPEDLLDLVVQADAIRRQQQGIPLSTFPRWKRFWIEPIFNLAGLAFGQGLALLPWPLRWRADLRINRMLGGNQAAAAPDLEQRTQDLSALTARLHAETGRWPATFIFTSHAPTTGPLEWLRFELLRQALILSNAVVDTEQRGLFRRTPKCFLAIDPFALDTLPSAVAGFYSGWMHRVYMVWDRQQTTQSWIQRWLFLRRTGYAHIFWRLLHSVKSSTPSLIVLPGGLPYNARLLYAAREFVYRLRVKRWPYPKRAAQKKLIEILMQPVGNILPAEEGHLPEPTRRSIGEWLTTLGIDAAQQPALLNEFAQEFQREVPYRERLFKILFNRLVERGTPLLWMAVSHRMREPYVQLSQPWAVFRDPQGKIRLLHSAAAAPQTATDAAAIAREFNQAF